jgi:Domain of unknown function (DUF4262)
MAHKRAKRFDFDAKRRTQVFVCTRVHEGAPVLEVAHDDDGDWQFLCGGAHEEGGPETALVACLECVVAADPSLNDVANLARNASATRKHPARAWKRRDDTDAHIRDEVEAVGWSVHVVEDDPPLGYTIGLYRTFRAPELVAVGLSAATLRDLLEAAAGLVKTKRKLPVGKPFDGVLHGYETVLRQVRAPRSVRRLARAIAFHHGRRDFPILQLLWPDRAGRFPGDPAVDPKVAARQPLLP